jgi:NADH-quinone oxidoreductase subunit J
MVEMYLFIIVGVIAVVAATLMLLSDNAVHAALFLILNFACVAFFFLMLDAPFLAMVQLAVYAGAIMVLFLFVIMLLGAEQAEPAIRVMGTLPGSRAYTLAAVLMSLVLLVVVGILLASNTVDTIDPQAQPVVRVVHGAQSVGLAQIAVEGEVIAGEVAFGETSDFLELAPGDYDVVVSQVVLAEAGEEAEAPVVWEGTLAVAAPQAPNVVTTVVLYDQYETILHEGNPTRTVSVFDVDYNPPANDQARVVVFNGIEQNAALSDTGAFNRIGDTSVLIEEIPTGEASAPLLLNEGRYNSLRLMPPAQAEADDGEGQPLFSIPNREFERNTTTLLLMGAVAGTESPTVRYLDDVTFSVFGSPQAVGEMLFVEYLLPMQLVALVLLASLVGVILIAQQQVAPEGQPSAARRAVRRRVSRPLTSVIASQVSSDDDAPRISSGSDGSGQPAGD